MLRNRILKCARFGLLQGNSFGYLAIAINSFEFWLELLNLGRRRGQVRFDHSKGDRVTILQTNIPKNSLPGNLSAIAGTYISQNECLLGPAQSTKLVLSGNL
jgi:hypothetical protein